jgi:hypothetical protein
MPSVGNSVIFTTTIVATGVAQQLPNNPLQNGGTFQSTAGAVTLGTTSAVTAATGYTLAANVPVTFTGSNTNQLFVTGTAAGTISFLGN